MPKILRSRAAFLSLGLSAAFLAGCASNTRVEPPAPVESRGTGTISGAGTGAAQGAGTGGVGSSAVTPVDTGRNADAAAGAGRVVYFDFDSFVVKDEYRSVVEAHARRMSADRKRRMIVEGHTDERGGREYNLALGQKRADAVVRSMVLLGAQDGQLEAVSFGKERPAAQGSDEAAWAKNRRAELKDR
jgi:peptidoglycan-associated lipoprotein